MNSYKRKILLGLVSVGFVIGISGCGAAKIADVPSQEIYQKTSTEKVYKAIVRAGAGLGWVVHKANDNTAIATLNIRSHQAIATIKYTAKDYSINYKSSTNLNYNSEDNTIHKNYNSWIVNLNNAIKLQLSLD